MQSVFEQDLERLVKQYDQPGPSYTSYPTVPVWPQGSFGREYAEALEAEGTKDRRISIYLHIPFCRTLCTFCGCNKVITRDPRNHRDHRCFASWPSLCCASQ